MKVKVVPDIEYLRIYLHSAKHTFDTLDTETAIEMTLIEIQGLLDYLDWIDTVNQSIVFVGAGGKIRTKEIYDIEKRLESLKNGKENG